jgi:mannose-6-phosphate isomerase-like protein (cupin superfamily)
MGNGYTKKRITDVADSAGKFGFGETQEARFASDELDAEQTGISHHRVKPGKRQAFAHRHDGAEEIYFVVSGSGRVKLDDDILDVEERDVIRVAPRVVRTWEAGENGLEILAFGPRRREDRGEMLQNWWSD